jgi:hypothetical protein
MKPQSPVPRSQPCFADRFTVPKLTRHPFSQRQRAPKGLTYQLISHRIILFAIVPRLLQTLMLPRIPRFRHPRLTTPLNDRYREIRFLISPLHCAHRVSCRTTQIQKAYPQKKYSYVIQCHETRVDTSRVLTLVEEFSDS